MLNKNFPCTWWSLNVHIRETKKKGALDKLKQNHFPCIPELIDVIWAQQKLTIQNKAKLESCSLCATNTSSEVTYPCDRVRHRYSLDTLQTCDSHSNPKNLFFFFPTFFVWMLWGHSKNVCELCNDKNDLRNIWCHIFEIRALSVHFL